MEELQVRSFRTRVAKLVSGVSEVVRLRPVLPPRKVVSATTASSLLVVVILGFLISSRWIDFPTFSGISFQKTFSFSQTPFHYPKREGYLLNCTTANMTIICPANYPATLKLNSSSSEQCPDYFRWIHEDLLPWKKRGITRKMVEKSEKFAHFRLVIVNGTAYVKQYDKAYQSRDLFTLWGVLQLLRLYPGRLPDLDLMFQCHDQPSIQKDWYWGWLTAVPPLFHYCGSDTTLDIVFPDWSFWGWPEVNIKPWELLMKDIEEGNRKTNWTDREAFAFWRGNLYTGPRAKLGECNSTKDWNAVIYNHDWGKEVTEGFKDSDLAKQCTHRYKVYMEGNAWSVSEKYILACDSMTLLVNPNFYDFFTRSLVPMKHYWPINEHPKYICRSIKFAVEWGNTHTEKAQEIGRGGSRFIKDEISMANVYDYMFHVLDEYGKLFRYKPSIPPGAVELCSEKWGCSPNGLEKTDKVETMASPTQRNPCAMPAPYDRRALRLFRTTFDFVTGETCLWPANTRSVASAAIS
ncbi:hypothetical protein Nepgr_019091 [Nepenthes gracilis]|uniref:Glycosyl transferase CAP10 domain-containing protein n=1 Tax=Nepenthes gracilis TaxID=150966 RepID=A0AAD3XUW7_NEPGR|nr:hypothetical protein Nepgr_019091 [Nepenthes gracilis]